MAGAAGSGGDIIDPTAGIPQERCSPRPRSLPGSLAQQSFGIGGMTGLQEARRV